MAVARYFFCGVVQSDEETSRTGPKAQLCVCVCVCVRVIRCSQVLPVSLNSGDFRTDLIIYKSYAGY